MAFFFMNAFAQSTDCLYVLTVNLIDSSEVKPSSVRDGIKKVFGNKFELSRFSENYSKKDQRIIVKSNIEMPSAISVFTPIDSISRHSYTEVVKKSVQMLQVAERQGKHSPWEEAKNDIKHKRVSFFKNGQKKSTEEYSGDLIDLVFMPYYWLGRPVEIKPLKVNVATSNSLYKDQVFTPSELKVNFLGKQMDVVRFVRQSKKANEFNLEIWVNKKDGQPVRVIRVMNPEVGVQIDTYPVN
jgi:hypothetical protein